MVPRDGKSIPLLRRCWELERRAARKKKRGLRGGDASFCEAR